MPALKASFKNSLNTLSGKSPEIVIKNENIPPRSPYTRINNNKLALVDDDGVNESQNLLNNIDETTITEAKIRIYRSKEIISPTKAPTTPPQTTNQPK